MKDSMKNFREASNLILKNIYVTDELKRKTLEKCTNRKIFKIKPLLTVTFSSALMVFGGIFIFFFHKPAIIDSHIAKSIAQEYKNSPDNEKEITEASKTANINNLDKSYSTASDNKNNESMSQGENIDIAIEDSKNISQDKNIDTANKNTEAASQNKDDSNKPSGNIHQDKGIDSVNKHAEATLQDKGDPNKPSDSIPQNKVAINIGNSNDDAGLAPQANSNLTLVREPLTVEKAEKYFESKILLPSYTPEGFKLTGVSIPDNTLKCIKLKYSSDSAYFEILQSKTLSTLEGTKKISIGNNTAFINSIKDEKTNIITTKITWILNGVQYSLSSSLPEDSLIKIAKSIN